MQISKLSMFFGALLIAVTGYFMIWGFEFIGTSSKIIFILATLFGVFMAFNIGGNDVANSFGTSVGAGTLTLTQALCIAAVFEVSGAVLAGGEVTATIRSGIVDLEKLSVSPNEFIYIMMSALIAAALWLLLATKKGWPVSTTHAIIGAIVGSSMTLGFILDLPGVSVFSLVKWSKIGTIAFSWVLSPLLGGLASYLLYKAIKKYILNYNAIAEIKIEKLKKRKKELKKEHKNMFESLSDIQKVNYTEAMNRDIYTMKDPNFDPTDLDSEYFKKMDELDRQKDELKSHQALELGIPAIAALGIAVITSMLLFKGLQNLQLGLSSLHNYLIIAMVSATTWMAMFIFAKTLRRSDLSKSTFLMFSWLQVFTASGFAFSHGSNDIANAVGPFAAIMDTLATGQINAHAQIPPIVMITFGVALIVGLWFIGKEVIATVGTHLTKIHPASGFSAELSAASVVMLASVLGLPVSSTHILIGAILGIGIANAQTNWKLMKPIALAWIITLPASAALSAIWFIVFRLVF
ncbi:inorganic phosphate transporter [Campylobacter geochelonis]|uniref:inorganic phosphate transporter n=1 Tax=Campylobacter geochelonis TaxID=1780362 RepID=UPI00077094B8|nr:inorganic phosphate transporter [Campylobacter geochelonis]CZE46548.1 phosphate transporter [Campylobacter geochelonis]CZE50423.1 phosphate transporter [Campylobacter geochelonis]